MAESMIDLNDLFQLQEQDMRSYSPLTLAYIGDAIFELVIRTVLVKKGNCPVNQLHKRASELVKASAQSEMIRSLDPFLTEEERDVFKRGRNAHSGSMAKNASMGDYRRATGFEALMGYLYLKKEYGRMLELIRLGIGEEKL